MKLSQLYGQPCHPDPEIVGLTADSRAVAPGFLYAALAGVQHHGADFIDDAVGRGAAAILCAPGDSHAALPMIEDPKPRRRLAQMAAAFYGRQPAIVAGVTGTNGKTSTAQFAAQLWGLLGAPAGSVGTLGAFGPSYHRALRHTTPDPVELHEVLRDLAAAGANYAAIEVSSHALAQHRADGVKISLAAFSNITQDHLDYHDSFDDYFAAKKRLFTELLVDGGAAVINADDVYGQKLIDALGGYDRRIFTTGAEGEDLTLFRCAPHGEGLELKIRAGDGLFDIDLPLIGAFQAENALLAAGLVIASGFEANDVVPLLSKLSGAPGRMQRAASVGGGAIYIDYAHTPAGLDAAIAAARPHTKGRLLVICGAGGDRDAAKRPLMGAAAAKADLVIVTDDNPRSEDPAAIRASVAAGAPGALEIGDRAEAISYGASLLRQGDVLLIAGKGHETGQIIGDKTLPFNDAQAARAAALKFGGVEEGEA